MHRLQDEAGAALLGARWTGRWRGWPSGGFGCLLRRLRCCLCGVVVFDQPGGVYRRHSLESRELGACGVRLFTPILGTLGGVMAWGSVGRPGTVDLSAGELLLITGSIGGSGLN